jgi:uncharacterized protein YjdB
VTIRTGNAGARITASVTPARATNATITWSTPSDLVTLDTTAGTTVVVTARNATNRPQWVPITATILNGFRVTAYVYAEPRYVNAPALTAAPKISAPQDGRISVSYGFDLGTHDDQSLVSWFVCEDAHAPNPAASPSAAETSP